MIEFSALIPKLKKQIEMTSFRKGRPRLKSFFRGDFPNSRTEEDSASILVSKCAKLLISYTLLRDSVALTLPKNKLFWKIKFCVILSYKLLKSKITQNLFFRNNFKIINNSAHLYTNIEALSSFVLELGKSPRKKLEVRPAPLNDVISIFFFSILESVLKTLSHVTPSIFNF